MNQKKWSFSRPTLFLLCLLVCLSCTAYAQEGTLPIISKEQAESNAIAEPATISFDQTKIEDLLTQYPATLENKGIVERDLTRIGIPSSVASQILNSKFNREVINAYLSSIGSSKTAPLQHQTRATGKCSCGYTMSTNITVDGSSGQVFHSSISCSSASINSYVTKAKGIARFLFGYPTANENSSNIQSTHFLFGEHDCNLYGTGSEGTHEGIDLRYTANDNESFRTVSDGVVKALDTGSNGYGTLAIRHPDGTHNILFLHADRYASDVTIGKTISGTSFVGYQGGR